MALVLTAIIPGLAQSTTKSLSTNFTLVNLGGDEARGTVEYFLPDGTAWGDGSEDFTITDPGGQAIFRQYDPAGNPGNPNLTNDAGSVVVSADQPLGAVVQIQARGQNPTSNGAYSGFEGGADSFYVPLAARQLQTASGMANSQVIVQNTGSSAADVEVELIASDGTSEYTKDGGSLAPGASFYYDLATELPANVPDGWYGSAVARTTTAGAEIAVVSNFFTGDGMQTFNAFATPGTTWYAPLFTSRLANGLSSPIAVQNLSGGDIPIDGVTVDCTPDPGLAGGTAFSMTNDTAIGDSASYFFNPVTDMSIPAAWYGACTVDSGSYDVVAFVQMRFVVAQGAAQEEAASYEAIPGDSTDMNVSIPLVSKRLGNGFATAVTIQNLSAVTATVDIDYACGADPCPVGNATYSYPDQEIAPGGSLIHNHRVAGLAMPDGWYGTMTVTGDQAIHAFVQLTFLRNVNPALPGGDNYMAHNAFTTQ
jgi:hypothetical protein